MSALDRFSPATRDWFTGAFEGATAAQEGAWDAVADGQHALVVAPTGSGKTLAAFLWALDRLATTPPPEEAHAPLPGPLRLADEGAHRRRAAQPALAAGRAAPGRAPPRDDRARRHGRLAHRRHPRRRAAQLQPHAAGHPRHHARVAVPAAHLGGARVAARGRHGDRRRGARRARLQARGAPRAQPRAPRRPARRPGPAHRAVGHRAPGRRGRDLPRRRTPGADRQPGDAEDRAGPRRGAGRGHGRARRRPARRAQRRGGGRGLGRRRGAAGLDLAGGAERGARPRRRAPVDHRVRQLPAARRAAHRAAQRAGGRGGAGGRRPRHRREARGAPASARFPAEAVGQSGIGGGAPADRREGPPRLDEPQAAHARRGGAEVRAAARASWPRRAWSWASTWARSTSWSRSRRRRRWRSGLQRVGRAGHQVGAVSRGVVFPKYRGDLVVVRRGGRAHGRRRDRGDALPAQPARRPRPARRGDDGDGAVVGRRPHLAGAAGRARSRRCRTPRCTPCSTCSPGATRREEFGELRPRITWDRVTDQLAGRPGAQRLAVTSRRHDPRPRAVHGHDARAGEDGTAAPGWASSTRRWSTSRGSATRSCSGPLSWRVHDITHDRVDRRARARRSPRGCRSGRATPRAARSSWAARWARSSAR